MPTAPISTPTAPGIPGAAPVQAAPNNGSTSPMIVTSSASRAQTAANVSKLQSLTQPTQTPSATPGATPAANPTPSPTPATAGTTINIHPPAASNVDQNYQLQPGETTDAYNARIAGYNASKTPAAPAAPTAPSTPSTTTSDTSNSTSDPYASALASITDPALAAQYRTALQSLDDSAAAAKQNIANLQNASYQTDPATQSLIASITAKYDQQIQAMQARNAQVIGRANTSVGAFGGLGTMSQDFLSNEQSQADQRVQDLQNQEQSLIMQAQAAFQTNNTKALNDAMTQYGSINKQKLDALNQLLSATNTQIAQQQKQQQLDETKAKDEQTIQLQQMMDSHTIDYQDKQQALAQATLDEKTKNDLAQRAIAAQTALKGRYQLNASTGEVFDTETGKIVGSSSANILNGAVTPGSTGNVLLDNNTKTTSSGVPYIDGSSFVGKQAQDAQLAAAQAGIPFLNKTAAFAVQNIQSAKDNINAIQGTISDINPTNGVTRPFVTIGHMLESFTQIGPGAVEVGSFSTYREGAIKAIEGLAVGGTGLRVNQTEINQMMQNIPSYNDTQAVAQGKLSKLNAMLDSNERGIIGSAVYDKYNPDAAATNLASYAQASPDHQAQINQIRQAQPNLTPAQVLQIVQP